MKCPKCGYEDFWQKLYDQIEREQMYKPIPKWTGW